MKIKIKDFVEIEYTGVIKEGNVIFDTTSEKVAKENNLFDKDADYGPVVICIGEEQVLKGIDSALVGKEPGEYKIELNAEQAFGNKDPKLIQLMPTSKFRQQQIQPVPGLQVNIDGIFGIVKTVSGGRTLVDFNHPLAGKDLIYNLKVNGILDDDKKKIIAYLKMAFGIKNCEVELEGGNARAELKSELSEKLKKEMEKKIMDAIPSIKKIEFVIEREGKK